MEDNERTKYTHGLKYTHASQFSKLTYWWMRDILKKGYRKTLKVDDIVEPIDSISCERNAAAFEREWAKLSPAQVQKRGCIFWLLMRLFWWQLIRAYFFTGFTDFIRILVQLLMRYIYEYLEGSLDISQSASWAMMLTAIFMMLIYSITLNNCIRVLLTVGLQMKIALASVIYKKVLRLSNAAFNETTSGHIITLISSDAETFDVGFTFIYCWFCSPFVFITVFIYEGIDIGSPILTAIGITTFILILQYKSGKVAGRLRHKQAKRTDERVQLLNQIIRAMRVIKMYCWEKPFGTLANGIRRSEMSVQFWRSALVVFGIASGYPCMKLIAFFMSMHHILTGNLFTVGQRMTLLGCLSVIQFAAFTYISPSFISAEEMIASSDRIKAFLLLEEKTDERIELNGKGLELKEVVAGWPVKKENTSQLILRNISLDASPGMLVAVAGAVGSGKSMLLTVCLGEIKLTKGRCNIGGRIEYVPQETWIMSESVRDNILLGQDYNPTWYNRIITSCGLDEDLRHFPHGDQTLVGERGLTLSGGQRARIGLARAVYQDADIYLLDDPLAAIDGKVANIIVFQCIMGLLKTKTTILTTHQLHYLPHADKILVLDEGNVIAQGSYDETIQAIHEHVEVKSKQKQTKLDQPIFSSNEINQHIQMNLLDAFSKEAADDDKVGSVSASVYLQYLKAGRGAYLIPLYVVLVGIAMSSGVLHDWLYFQWGGNQGNLTTLQRNNQFLLSLTPGLVFDNEWFMKVLGSLILIMVVFYYLSFMLVVYIFKTAGERLYNQMFSRLLRAPLHFFETNPVGRVLNRFSRDTAFMDVHILYPIAIAILYAIPWITEMVYVCVVVPWCLVPLSVYIGLLLLSLRFLLPASRQIKRIEASLRSPFYSHLASTLDGLLVIRSSGKEQEFTDKAFKYLNGHSSAWFKYVCSLRFMGTFVDLLSSILISSSLIIMMLGSNPENQISVALGFTYLPGSVLSTSMCFIYIAQTETMMTSIERIQHYNRLDQEPLTVGDINKPTDWPHEGSIHMINVILKYRNQNQAALGPINLSIKPGEKIGVAGRTGAGKSSLIACLLRLVEPEGTILIDSINIKDLALTDLRSSISVIPQEPVLFNGSLKHNLDPFGEFSDEDLWITLEKVQLKRKVLDLPGQLMAEMGNSGSNFSVGEKQLLCLARAIIRRNKIVLIDEATSNVDNRTDEIIQETLEGALRDATVITIAHRLNTLIGVDKIMVLENGIVLEIGHPFDLLQDMSGAFHDMVGRLGEENLAFFRRATQENKLKRIVHYKDNVHISPREEHMNVTRL